MQKSPFARTWVILLALIPALLIGLTASHYVSSLEPSGATHPQPVTDATFHSTDSGYVVVKDRQPPVRQWPMTKLTTLPPAPSQPGNDIDLTRKNLSDLDLRQAGDLLVKYATFGTETVWPKQLPDGFDPQKFMELGKDPGLGIRALQKQGITGKGVRVAILDQTLLRTHEEYKGQVKSYTEVGLVVTSPELHGAAVASLLAGKSIGVAPGVTLEYYATEFIKDWNTRTRTFLPMAQVINLILDENKNLPRQEQVRVISASIGVMAQEEGYAELLQAYQRAIREGVLVVTTDMNNHYPYDFWGLGRQPASDPNDPRSYIPGDWWADRFYGGDPMFSATSGSKAIYVPMDSRTVASPTGDKKYTFYRTGGESWAIPYAAGVYALVLQ
ncbi:MAG: S8 family serine peptidase, partial [Mycobacterium leprae]